MTGNTAKRANTVAGDRKAEDENRRRKSKTRRFLKKTWGKYKPSLCLGGLKWRTDTDREEVLKHAYPQQWLPTRANPDPCEWTLTYSGPAPLVCDQLVQALLNEALQQRPAGPPRQSVPHQRPAQRPVVLKQEQGQQTREEEQSSLLLVTHWKLSHLGSKMIKNDKSTKWLKWSRSWGMWKIYFGCRLTCSVTGCVTDSRTGGLFKVSVTGTAMDPPSGGICECQDKLYTSVK